MRFIPVPLLVCMDGVSLSNSDVYHYVVARNLRVCIYAIFPAIFSGAMIQRIG